MEVLQTHVDRLSSAFQANRAHHLALRDDLRANLAKARTGGPERARKRHSDRGALMVRERIDLLLDPGNPFLKLSPITT